MKLDPVINQEPKEQLVPTFSKKEIEELIEKKIAESGISGGTKLYKHVIELESTYQDEPVSSTLTLINNSNASLANKNWNRLVGYISATIVVDGAREQQVVSIINEQDETHIIYYDNYGELSKVYPEWSGEHHGLTVSDTVTEL